MTQATSFNQMNKDELIAVGKTFGTDLVNSMTKPAMIEALGVDGVTFQEYKKTIRLNDEDPVELATIDDAPLENSYEPSEDVSDDEGYVIKMTRKNKTYQVRGYEFTQDHPYALVSEEDADYLVENGGFRMAGPKELREYYAL